jgi:hypothetical protein
MTTGYQSPPDLMTDQVEHRRQLAQALRNVMQGKLNAVLQVTLAANTTTTTVTDARIGASTGIFFSPLTANAAGAISGLYVSAQKKGQATFTHANSATTDRTFNALLIG